MTKKLGVITVCILFIVVFLASCGGNSSGSSAPSTNTYTYTIGGTVSGLLGNLVLLNNLGNNFTVVANSSFTFSKPVNNGSPYSVTILTQPAGQTCTIANGSGTTSGANVTTVAVNCTPTWTTAALIENNNAGDAILPQIAIDTNGNALAVWSQSDGTRNNIWSSRYTASTHNWGIPVLIETDNAGTAADIYSPQVVIDTNGNALAVWCQFDGARYNIWANRYTANTNTWGSAALIETDNSGTAIAPNIAIDTNGNGLVVWNQAVGARYNIWANRYTASTNTWGTATLIETDDTGNAYAPKIAIDTNGNGIAVWEQATITQNNQYNIWTNRYTASTNTWGTATQIETDNTGGAAEANIAFDTNGNALAVWRKSDGTRYNIWSSRYTAGTSNSWGSPVLIETDNVGSAYSPKIAFDTNGNAMAVWYQYAAGAAYNRIWSNRYTASSGSWGIATMVDNNNALKDADSPQIAIEPSGNILVVWRQLDGIRNDSDIWSKRYTVGTNTWGVAMLIETDNSGSAFNPQVVVDINGNALSVWSQFDGTRNSIWFNRF